MTGYGKRERNLDYLRWLKTLPCAVEGCDSGLPTEAAHTTAPGRRGMSQKGSDEDAIPLCGAVPWIGNEDHHRNGKDSIHKLGPAFWEHHGIDRNELLGRLHHAWKLIKSAREDRNGVTRRVSI